METFVRKPFQDEYGVEFSTCGDVTTLTRMPKDFKGAYRIPDFVTNLGMGAINGCNDLTSITIPKNLTDIGKDNFELCEQLTEMIVNPANPMFDSRDNCNAIIVTSTNTLVQGCNGSTIPNGIEVIADYAFSQRRNLSHITIPDSVVYIGEFAFLCCFSLENDIQLHYIRQVSRCCFDGCSQLKSVIIGSGIETIEPHAFAGCSHLRQVNIAEGLETIENGAFADCISLASITLPQSLKEIEPDAFQNCNSLRQILIPYGTTNHFSRFIALKQYRHRLIELSK